MDEEFRNAMSAAIDDSGDTATATPETTSPATNTETASEPKPADTGSTPEGAAPTGDQWRFNSTEWDDKHPDLKQYRTQLQADYTRAQQALAEQRKSFEGVRPELIGWAADLDRLAAENPARAVAILEAQVAQLRAGQEPADDPDLEFVTESDRQVHQRLRTMEQFVQQQRLTALDAQLNNQFSQLEQQYGTIPFEERQQVIAQMARHGAPPEVVKHYWAGMNLDKVTQKAKDEASRSVAQKTAIGGAPSGIASRAGDVESPPKNFREAMERKLREVA